MATVAQDLVASSSKVLAQALAQALAQSTPVLRGGPRKKITRCPLYKSNNF
jgi:hypothetical protein